MKLVLASNNAGKLASSGAMLIKAHLAAPPPEIERGSDTAPDEGTRP